MQSLSLYANIFIYIYITVIYEYLDIVMLFTVVASCVFLLLLFYRVFFSTAGVMDLSRYSKQWSSQTFAAGEDWMNRQPQPRVTCCSYS